MTLIPTMSCDIVTTMSHCLCHMAEPLMTHDKIYFFKKN